MRCVGVRRVAIAFSLVCASLVALDGPTRAATILPSAQVAADGAAPASHGVDRNRLPLSAVNQAALIPFFEDNLTLWSLVMSGFALTALILRRRRRLPSVTY